MTFNSFIHRSKSKAQYYFHITWQILTRLRLQQKGVCLRCAAGTCVVSCANMCDVSRADSSCTVVEANLSRRCHPALGFCL